MEGVTYNPLEADRKLSCPKEVPPHPGIVPGPAKPASSNFTVVPGSFCPTHFNLRHLELSLRPVTPSDWVPTSPLLKKEANTTCHREALSHQTEALSVTCFSCPVG